ncbi:hypothetical protein L2744_21410, partial [Shewanella profunda]|uniref:hypothetical protein n=1 Tax=Shewanella profunda TaxID=254793 RepID=UPI00200F6C7E
MVSSFISWLMKSRHKHPLLRHSPKLDSRALGRFNEVVEHLNSTISEEVSICKMLTFSLSVPW